MKQVIKVSGKRYEIVVEQDQGHDSPSEWGNYELITPNKKIANNYGFFNYIENEEGDFEKDPLKSYVPLYILDHSGISISRGKTCQWDSFLAGYMEIDTFDEEGVDVFINELNQYLCGDVYYLEVSELIKCSCCEEDKKVEVANLSGIYGTNGVIEYIAEFINVSIEEIKGKLEVA